MNPENMTDEQAQQQLDELRESHPINGALQDLAPFIMHATQNNGAITPQNVLYLAEAAQQAVNVLLPECHRMAGENDLLRQRNAELLFIISGAKSNGGNA